MEYITIKEAANKWFVSERMVQLMCKNNQIPGTIKWGRSWMIPKDAVKPIDGRKKPEKEKKEQDWLDHLLPLMNSEFELGNLSAYIESLPTEEMRQIVLAEYAYFSGNDEEACKISEQWMNYEKLSVRLSAMVLFTYANLPLGHTRMSSVGLEKLQEMVKSMENAEMNQKQQAMYLFIYTMSRVLLHLSLDDVPPMEQYLCYLPRGLRAYACYIIARKAYLNGEYGRAQGIAETALLIQERPCIIPSIYLHLVSSMSLMAMKQIEEAKTHFMSAWELAKVDGILQPFAEHHDLLDGLIEICLQGAYPKEYRKIISITNRYSSGWRKVHNITSGDTVAENLTSLEFSIAMLANRGWTNAEIAEHLHFSEHTVKRYVSDIYQKLGISSRKQLQQFMLR